MIGVKTVLSGRGLLYEFGPGFSDVRNKGFVRHDEVQDQEGCQHQKKDKPHSQNDRSYCYLPFF